MLIEMRELPSAQRTEPEQDDLLMICLLGSFRLLRHGQPLDLLVAGKAMSLLSALALHLDAGMTREALLDTLWPDQESAQSIVSLNSLVYSLQRRLRADPHDASAVVYANGCYYLNAAAGYRTDIARFDALVDAGNRLAASGKEAAAACHYQRAVALYRGDLCTGTDVYVVIERERLRASFLTVLAWLADRAYREGDDVAALDHAVRLLACDPCREDAHRLVMRARMRRGERAQAMRQYRLCEHVLRREFDAEPEPLTTDLFDQIRNAPASV
jgi:DNA-binding SARP family transcriptional activator